MALLVHAHIMPTCPVCRQPFVRRRPEQRVCSRRCGWSGRTSRALDQHRSKTMKACGRCHQVKPLTDFWKNGAMIDGLKPNCKACENLARAERLARVRRDPARYAAYQQQQWRTHARAESKTTNGTLDEWLHHLSQPNRLRPDRPPRVRSQQSEAAAAAKREQMRHKARMKYQQDEAYRQACLAAARRDHVNKPWIMLARKHRRDARLANVFDDGSITAKTLRTIWLDTTDCLYCGRALTESTKSVEHMTPMCRGGIHSLSNVIIVCRRCNDQKRRLSFEEWLGCLKEPLRIKAYERFSKQ